MLGKEYVSENCGKPQLVYSAVAGITVGAIATWSLYYIIDYCITHSAAVLDMPLKIVLEVFFQNLWQAGLASLLSYIAVTFLSQLSSVIINFHSTYNIRLYDLHAMAGVIGAFTGCYLFASIIPEYEIALAVGGAIGGIATVSVFNIVETWHCNKKFSALPEKDQKTGVISRIPDQKLWIRTALWSTFGALSGVAAAFLSHMCAEEILVALNIPLTNTAVYLPILLGVAGCISVVVNKSLLGVQNFFESKFDYHLMDSEKPKPVQQIA